MFDIAEAVRANFRAYETRDRQHLEGLLAEDFTFTSPYDDHIGRAAYFERCWPNASRIKAVQITDLIARGADAFVRYEVEPEVGGRFHNAELHRFRGDKLVSVEVFFGEINGVEQKP